MSAGESERAREKSAPLPNTAPRYLLGRDFPGQRIGPEPTTDRFTVVLNGPEERTIPGNALSVHPDIPYTGRA